MLNNQDTDGLSEEQIEELNKQTPILENVIEQMFQFTRSSTIPIYGNFDSASGEVIGTGTFVTIDRKDYLITAQHVVSTGKENRFSKGMSRGNGDDKKLELIVSPWIEIEAPQDIAATALNGPFSSDSGLKTLKSKYIASDTTNLDHDCYFIIGWPGSQSHFTTFNPKGGGIVSDPLYYGGAITTSDDVIFDENFHIAITYKTNEKYPTNKGKYGELPNPGGLSGCLVWKTNFLCAKEEWSPEMARVIGVAQRYDPQNKCLIVTRVEYVRKMINETIKSSTS